MRKEEKGITLVALIITIVVMLILVAVSINILVNSNLIGHAEKTGDAYSGAIKNEEKLGNDGITINDKEYASIDDYIESRKPLPEGAGKKFTETKKYTDGTKTAVIPGGFTVSGIRNETRIDDGLVIYLIPDDEIENVKWDGTEKTKYDQFVWIPVTDANKMFMCQAKTESDSGCDLKIEGNEVICQTHKTADATKSKKMAGRLYATDIGENFNSSLTTQTYNANSGLREPAIVTGKADGTGTEFDGSNTDNNIGLTLATLQEEYNNAVKKVIESKGFWIGRYETSGMSSSNDDIAVNIVAGKVIEDGTSNVNWYRMYKQQQNYVSKKGLDTLTTQSTMIFGAAWDQTMIFANCANERTTNQVSFITGNVETDCYKNIYGLSGNLNNWTTEAFSDYIRVDRGGVVDVGHSASYRNAYVRMYSRNSIPNEGFFYRRF
mgnify:CR=1 FL=1